MENLNNLFSNKISLIKNKKMLVSILLVVSILYFVTSYYTHNKYH